MTTLPIPFLPSVFNPFWKPLGISIGLSIALCLGGCSTVRPGSENRESKRSELEETRKLLADLNNRIQILETKIAGINDKIDTTRQNLDHMNAEPNDNSKNLKNQQDQKDQKIQSSEIIDHPSTGVGVSVETLAIPKDPEGEFAHDAAVQTFRKSMILYLGQKYPESVLSFTEFLDRYPDHPLAGSAQYYIGEAYLKQKEYKLALQEFQRVLTSYDRSPHIADTLADMILAEEALKQTAESSKHHQMLTSLFPLSPAMVVLKDSQQPQKDSEAAPKEMNKEAPTSEAGLDRPPSVPLTTPIEEKAKTAPPTADPPSPGTP